MSTFQGYIQVYTGEGKGKTTAALGQGLRAAGHGMSVVMIQFMKGRRYGEINALKKIDNFQLIQSGRDKFVDRDHPATIDVKLAQEGWKLARKIIREEETQILILDEFNLVLSYGLIPLAEAVSTLKKKPSQLEIIITGREAPEKILELASLVSIIEERRHHFQEGIIARQGIEY